MSLFSGGVCSGATVGVEVDVWIVAGGGGGVGFACGAAKPAGCDDVKGSDFAKGAGGGVAEIGFGEGCGFTSVFIGGSGGGVGFTCGAAKPAGFGGAGCDIGGGVDCGIDGLEIGVG